MAPASASPARTPDAFLSAVQKIFRADQPGGEGFRRIGDFLDHLQANGHQLGQSTLYKYINGQSTMPIEIWLELRDWAADPELDALLAPADLGAHVAKRLKLLRVELCAALGRTIDELTASGPQPEGHQPEPGDGP